MSSQVAARIIHEALTGATAHCLQAPVVSGDLRSSLLHWPIIFVILFIFIIIIFCKPPEATEINRAALVDQVCRILDQRCRILPSARLRKPLVQSHFSALCFQCVVTALEEEGKDQSTFYRARVRYWVAIRAVPRITAARGLDLHQAAVHHAGRALFGALAWWVERSEARVVERGHAFGAAYSHRGVHCSAA